MKATKTLALVAIVASLLGEALSAQPPGDFAQVLAATQRYRLAWLSNNPDEIMSTLTDEPLLIPSGHEEISGAANVRAFWWPVDGPRTRVIAMLLLVDKAEVGGDIAYTRGRGDLTYAVEPSPGHEGTPTTNRSTFINILRRQADGRWLIAERMWSDLPH